MVLQIARRQIAPAALQASCDRIYFGAEFCEFLIPSPESLCAIAAQGKPLSLILPYCTDRTMGKVERLLEAIDPAWPDFEIITNDYGVLRMVKSLAYITPVCGRLLTQGLVNQFENQLIPMPNNVAVFLKSEYRVTRYEISVTRRKLRHHGNTTLPADLHFSMYLPFQYVTTSRQCVLRFRNVAPNTPLDQIGCDRKCQDRVYKIGYPEHVEESLYLKGNTLFVRYANFPYTPQELKDLGVDRLVYANELQG